MSVTNEMVKTGADRRRTQRMSLSFRIEVCGREPKGSVFHDETTTIDVNEHGCKFGIDHQVNRGDLVTIRHLSQDQSPVKEAKPILFQIVWAEGGETGWTVGAMKIEDKSVWPMAFPTASSSARSTASVY